MASKVEEFLVEQVQVLHDIVNVLALIAARQGASKEERDLLLRLMRESASVARTASEALREEEGR